MRLSWAAPAFLAARQAWHAFAGQARPGRAGENHNGAETCQRVGGLCGTAQGLWGCGRRWALFALCRRAGEADIARRLKSGRNLGGSGAFQSSDCLSACIESSASKAALPRSVRRSANSASARSIDINVSNSLLK